MTTQSLHKIETFVKVALSEISDLQSQVTTLTKQAEEKAQQDNELDIALKKAAEAMYHSDFINDEEEKLAFVKKAKEDAKYLASVVEKVCRAADVSYMGKSSSVKSLNSTDDPVMRRAFGYSGSYSLIED
jgi:hypothetical protein